LDGFATVLKLRADMVHLWKAKPQPCAKPNVPDWKNGVLRALCGRRVERACLPAAQSRDPLFC